MRHRVSKPGVRQVCMQINECKKATQQDTITASQLKYLMFNAQLSQYLFLFVYLFIFVHTMKVNGLLNNIRLQ